MAIFSVGLQFNNNDVHTFNLTALSFKHANKKIDNYALFYARNHYAHSYELKRSQVASVDSGYFCADYPLLKISAYNVTNNAVITTHKTDKYNIL